MGSHGNQGLAARGVSREVRDRRIKGKNMHSQVEELTANLGFPNSETAATMNQPTTQAIQDQDNGNQMS